MCCFSGYNLFTCLPVPGSSGKLSGHVNIYICWDTEVSLHRQPQVGLVRPVVEPRLVERDSKLARRSQLPPPVSLEQLATSLRARELSMERVS